LILQAIKNKTRPFQADKHRIMDPTTPPQSPKRQEFDTIKRGQFLMPMIASKRTPLSGESAAGQESIYCYGLKPLGGLG
jgi:hypothetical protein